MSDNHKRYNSIRTVRLDQIKFLVADRFVKRLSDPISEAVLVTMAYHGPDLG